MTVPWPDEDGWSPLDWPIDDRENWEHDLYVFSDRRGEWVVAPRMKVFELGKVGIDVLLRVGSRTAREELDYIFDVHYVGDTVEDVALFASKRMQPDGGTYSMIVVEYPPMSAVARGASAALRWLVTVYPDRILRSPVQAMTLEDRARDPHWKVPVICGPAIVTPMQEVLGLQVAVDADARRA